MTLEELRERCRVWQERLRLQDWHVEVSLVRQWDVPNCFGTVSMLFDKKMAKIKILDPVDDGDPDDFEAYDAERTLVHELLHVHFRPFEARDDTPEDTAQHQVIHALVDALIALDRKAD